ncbi:hypothetical protein DL762_001860 [Monosporascus cannonballus]|uniref:PNPLA domain-containing protein n=1 Tax=Monosporascus cannonballus TaxID=155416 RepID=A0ABY0HHM7_9PEZI|nr:hypothetical protein DL762_001860 [Monosporascus cannonballus]
MMDGIFSKKARRFKLNGSVQARFDTAELERCIKSIVRTYGMGKDENLLMRDPNIGCKVFVCLLELFENAKIWEVCRATAAATTFFNSIEIACGPQKIEFLDGATRANNPINDLWVEAKEAFGPDFASRVQCVVSIGNGESNHINFGSKALEAVQALKELTIETKRAHVEFNQNHPELGATNRYYRLNVIHGLERVGLEEEADKRDAIAGITMAYLDEDERRETLRKFRAAVTQSPSYLPALPLEMSSPRQPQPHATSQAFLTLGRESKWVNHHARVEPGSYWPRLTLASLQVYAAIYKVMRDPSTGEVDFTRFHNYFARLNPMPRELRNGDLVKQVWARLPLEGHDSAKTRDVVMAAIYMVHMEARVNESFRPNFSPPNSNTFSYHRAKFLWWYANWVRCACGCGRMWSFANGKEGLAYDRWKMDKNKGGGAEKTFNEALRLFDKNRVEWIKQQDEVTPVSIRVLEKGIAGHHVAVGPRPSENDGNLGPGKPANSNTFFGSGWDQSILPPLGGAKPSLSGGNFTY